MYDNHVYDNTPLFSIQILHQDLLEWYVAADMDIHEHTLMTWKKNPMQTQYMWAQAHL